MKHVLFVLLFPLIVCCQKNNDDRLSPIVLSAYLEDVAVTKADSDFPNNGKIAIVGAVCDTENPSPSTVTWTSPAIDHVRAKKSAGPTSEGEYTFAWEDNITRYWPLGGYLAFLSYSPSGIPTTTGATPISRNGTGFTITLPPKESNKNLPDFMYASGIVTDKAKHTVNFGTFRHVFSQVTIKIKAINVNPNVKMTKLEMVTAKNAVFNLINSTFTVTEGDRITYSFVSSPTQLLTSDTDYNADTNTPYMVFPDKDSGTNWTKINMTLVDTSNGTLVLDKSYDISDFVNSTTLLPAKLERATKTTLVITIKDYQVGTGSGVSSTLTSEAESWIYRGNYGINMD